nr:CHAT domain-containing protein [candidate division Zixibacteria bacterium]
MKSRFSHSVLIISVMIIMIYLSGVVFAGEADTTGVEILIHQADSLLAARNLDSADVVYRAAVDKAGTDSSMEDSTAVMAMFKQSICAFERGWPNESDSIWQLCHPRLIKIFGAESREAANSFFHGGDIQGENYEFETGLEFLEKSLEIRERLYGTESPELIRPLNLMGGYLNAMDMTDEAFEYLNRALAIMENRGQADSPLLIETHLFLGDIYCRTNISRAMECYRRAIEIGRIAGRPNYHLALAYSYLGNLMFGEGEIGQAVDYCEESLRILKALYGEDNMRYISTLWSYGHACTEYGYYARGMEMLNRAIAFLNKYSQEYPVALLQLYNLMAYLYSRQANHELAIEMYQKALEIQKRVRGENNYSTLNTQELMAKQYQILKDYKKAAEIIKGVIERGTANGMYETDMMAQSFMVMAAACFEMGEYDRADSLYCEGLAIAGRVYDTTGFDYSCYLAHIADDNRQLGRYDLAEKQWLEVLELHKRNLIEDHPYIAISYISLAAIYAATGRYEQAVESFLVAVRKRYNFITQIFTYASENQKLRYLKEFRMIVEPLLSLALLSGLESAREASYEMLLKGKGLVVDVMSSEMRVAACGINSDIGNLGEFHTRTCNEIAARVLRGRNSRDEKSGLDSLYLIKDSLETELSRYCPVYSDEMNGRNINVERVIRAIPPGYVLIDFIRYRPFDFSRSGRDDELFSPEHYLAFIINDQAEISMVDVGEVSLIDSLVEITRNRIYESEARVFSPAGITAEKNLKEVTGKLYGLVIEPLEAFWGDRDHLLISPDGALHFIPFEILTDRKNNYLIEKYHISYVTSGRDLLRFNSPADFSGYAMLMADPDYDANLGDDTPSGETKNSELTDLHSNHHRGAASCLTGPFPRLGYSREEIKAVEDNINSLSNLYIEEYLDINARESALMAIGQSPEILHLATHGFVCQDKEARDNLKIYIENPLLNSGLILAGGNHTLSHNDTNPKDEDGILTALEVCGMNLHGTRLVTLSACETALGDILYGEGVVGLRRAFQQAGAESILMSHWKISDRETSEYMSRFYRYWLGGLPRQEALRKTSLELMNETRKNYGHTHPFAWAGFTLVGNPN